MRGKRTPAIPMMTGIIRKLKWMVSWLEKAIQGIHTIPSRILVMVEHLVLHTQKTVLDMKVIHGSPDGMETNFGLYIKDNLLLRAIPMMTGITPKARWIRSLAARRMRNTLMMTCITPKAKWTPSFLTWQRRHGTASAASRLLLRRLTIPMMTGIIRKRRSTKSCRDCRPQDISTQSRTSQTFLPLARLRQRMWATLQRPVTRITMLVRPARAVRQTQPTN